MDGRRLLGRCSGTPSGLRRWFASFTEVFAEAAGVVGLSLWTKSSTSALHGKQKPDLDTEAVRLVRFLQHPEMPIFAICGFLRGRRRPLGSLGVR